MVQMNCVNYIVQAQSTVEFFYYSLAENEIIENYIELLIEQCHQINRIIDQFVQYRSDRFKRKMFY